MKNHLMRVVIGLIAILAFSTVVSAQAGPTREAMAIARQHCGQPGQPGTQYQVLCSDTKTPGPAPKHDISGTWSGPIGAVHVDPIPPMTELGKKLAALNHPNQAVNVADSNDPLNHCDPLGFPRNAVFELRGLSIGQMPNRVLILSQYQRAWREVWTNDHAQPKNAGSDDPSAPDPRYYGYSVGHWDGDYTFVVDTVGMDDTTWLDNEGHPHSADLRVTERYTRVDSNTLELTVAIDDPKIYTKPFVIGKTIFKWIPEQEFEEQLCIPSESQAYADAIAGPAGEKK
jgi:hypothetical protein